MKLFIGRYNAFKLISPIDSQYLLGIPYVQCIRKTAVNKRGKILCLPGVHIPMNKNETSFWRYNIKITKVLMSVAELSEGVRKSFFLLYAAVILC